MKIFSINLHHHMETDFYRKLETICDLIAKEKYDVIFFQEVGQFKMMPLMNDNIRQGNYISIIEHILFQKYHIKYKLFIDMFKESYECAYEEGMAVLYKGDLDFSSFYVSNSTSTKDWETRKVIRVKIDDIVVYSAHLGWDTEKEKFVDQMQKMNIDMNEKCLLIGDLNCDYDSNNYNIVAASGLVNVAERLKPTLLNYYTWINKSNIEEKEKIDYVFTNCIEDINDINYYFTDFSVSDHVCFGIEIK